MQSVLDLCRCAKEHALSLANLSTKQKNEYLQVVADGLRHHFSEILAANALDMAESCARPKQFLDRLALSEARIEAMACGIEQVLALPDPIGEVLEHFTRPNGLDFTRIRVPLGVIGIIYEARPNVTADTIALCIKSGNCVVLRGSKDALQSNKTIVAGIKAELISKGLETEYIQLIEDTSREGADSLMKMNGLIDVLLPRGGASLIQSVVKNSTIPVIETGVGICHVYVDSAADLTMAVSILVNGKTQRPSVCNAVESLLVDESVAGDFLPMAENALKPFGVELRGCEKTCAILPSACHATDTDYATEYLGYVLSVKVVHGVAEAIEHINHYGTHHSDAIITENADAASRFLREVDSAAVYVNASTRFTDGGEFGFGCELGISTQKLHARGPIGLKELTSYKYQIRGNGHVRG